MNVTAIINGSEKVIDCVNFAPGGALASRSLSISTAAHEIRLQFRPGKEEDKVLVWLLIGLVSILAHSDVDLEEETRHCMQMYHEIRANKGARLSAALAEDLAERIEVGDE